MSKKKDLVAFCRYYKGEKENPYKEGDEALFWEYEKKWVEFTLEAYEKGDSAILGTSLNEYVSAGLGLFECADNTPATLKALLYNRYCHWVQGSPDEFKKWYVEVYKKEKKDS